MKKLTAKIVVTRVLVFLLCAGVVCGSVFLPPAIAKRSDDSLLGKNQTVEADDLYSFHREEINTLEKLQILEEVHFFDAIAVSSGTRMKQNEAYERIGEEMDLLVFLPIIPQSEDDEREILMPQAYMFVNLDKNKENLIVWITKFYFSDSGYGVVAMDDETGKILQFSFTSNGFYARYPFLNLFEDFNAFNAYMDSIAKYLEIELRGGMVPDLSSIIGYDSYTDDLKYYYDDLDYYYNVNPVFSFGFSLEDDPKEITEVTYSIGLTRFSFGFLGYNTSETGSGERLNADLSKIRPSPQPENYGKTVVSSSDDYETDTVMDDKDVY